MDAADRLALAAIIVSIGSLGFTVWWTARSEKEERRRDVLRESLRQIIANSKKLSHEHNKAFRLLHNSVQSGPLVDADRRSASDERRHEVGIELVLLRGLGSDSVGAAAQKLYDAHVRVRHAIFHVECGEHADCEGDRKVAWDDVVRWGPSDRPTVNIFAKFDGLHSALLDAIATDIRMKTPKRGDFQDG